MDEPETHREVWAYEGAHPCCCPGAFQLEISCPLWLKRFWSWTSSLFVTRPSTASILLGKPVVQTITKGIKALLAEANEQVETISTADAVALLNSNDHVFIDLRDIRELKRVGKIPGAFSCPRGMLEFWIDPESPYHKDVFNQDKTYVFYCASAWRSALSAKVAMEMGLNPVVHIEGGFTAWLKDDAPVEIVE